MSNHKIQFSLEFNADTKKAEQAMRKLQQALDNAISASTSGKDLGLVPKLDIARKSAIQLKVALNNAMNVDTGKLNLHKFSKELRSAGLDVNKLATHMKRLGPEGVEAFQQMTQAIVTAENKVFSLEGGMKRLANTFMNTVRYQASSAAINAMTSSITNAISYTKELDKSLTDIMMVTRYTRDEMNSFAVSANKAAKALSTSTNAYAKASLIYFQQGFDMGEAMKRAETTIRLAHATGESAQEVSEWMTAIWNNFDNGTKTLEYYGDILAKLGAATASSADEIAAGLSKFAAVAETVGLSYEYASAALATLTSETRESADVVGTALKTLFSRMESLQLGETLDDGTTLGKYSLALQAVGVNIKDTNGELKDMDQILDETAAKWTILSKDQQVALAQSVAGVRQYTQFIALMDNYGTMQSNMALAQSDQQKSLKEMQEDYKNSIEGIKEEQKAAGETLSGALMDEDDIKTFYKAMIKITEFVTDLVDAFGGLDGILLQVSAALTKLYQPKIGAFMSNLGLSIKDTGVHLANFGLRFVGKQNKFQTSGEKMREDAIRQAGIMEANKGGPEGAVEVTKKITEAKIDLQQRANQLTDSEKQLYQGQIQFLEAVKQVVAEEAEHLQVLEEERGIFEDKAKAAYNAKEINAQAAEEAKKEAQAIADAIARRAELKQQMADDRTVAKKAGAFQPGIDAAVTKAEEYRREYTETKDGKRVIAKGDMKAKREEIGNDMAVVLDQLEKKADGLDLDFSGARSSLSKFVKQGGSEIDVFIAKLTELQEAVEGKRKGAKERLASGAEEFKQLAATASKKPPAAPEEVLELDTDYVEQRSRKIGTMQGSMDRAVNKMSGITMGTKQPQRQAVGKQASEALAEAKAQAEELGLNLADLGFDEAAEDLDKFVNEGVGSLDELIKKLKQVQEAVNDASAVELSNTAVNAVTGTQNSAIAGFNTLEKAGSGSASDTIGMLDKGLTQLDAGTSSDPGAKKTQKVSASSKQTITALKQEAAGLKAKLEAQKKVLAQTKKGTKEEQKAAQAIKKTEKEIRAFNAKVKEQTRLMQADRDAVADATQETDGYADAQDRAADEVQELANKTAEAEKQNVAVQNSMGDLQDEADNLGQGLGKIKFTDMFAGFVSSAASVAAGFNAIRSGVASFTDAINDSDATLGDYLTSLASMGTGLMELGAPFVKAIGWIMAKMAAQKASQKVDDQTTNNEIKNNTKEAASAGATGLVHVAKNMAKGPVGWVMAAIGIAALAAVGISAGISAVKAGQNDAAEEQQEAELEVNREVNAAATEVSKTLTGLSEQTDTFKNLRESGESTVEVLKEMESSVKNFKDQIAELQSKAGSSSNWRFLDGLTSELDAKFEAFKTGQISEDEFSEFVNEANKKVNQTSSRTALSTAQKSMSVEDFNAFYTQAGTTLEDNENLMKQAEKEFLAGTYKDAEEAEEAWAKVAAYAALGPEYTGNYVPTSEEAINKLLSYAPSSVHRVINGLRMFAPNGAIANKYGTDIAQQAQSWAGRNQSKLAYANSIDFSTGSEEDWNQQYLAAMDKTKEAELTMEADKLGYDEQTFETYVDLLVDANEQLTENDKTSKQLAVNNLKLNAGLAELTKGWSDVSDVLAEGNRGTLEYAKAIGAVKNALKETFGYAPSTKFIEENLGLIEELANGNVDALDNLQTKIAEDMVLNIEYRTAIDGVSRSPEYIQSVLLGLLADLDDDMGIELGAGATISDDYLDALQGLLDNGQITEEKLNEIMRAKGFEIEYDGWKEMPGPKSTIKQHITEGGKTRTVTIQQEETLQVPIINGKVPEGVTTAGNPQSKATIVKSSDASAIDSSTFGKTTKGGKNSEIERYHEIKEVLSDVERQLTKISKAKDRAFGQQKLALMQQEIDKQDELIAAEQKYLRQIQEKYNEDLSNLDSRFQLDESGRIKNYEETLKALQAKYGSGSEKYEELKAAADQYEETLNELEAQQEVVNDAINEAADMALEKIEYNVEIKVHFNDRDIKHFNFLLEKLDDPLQDAAEAIALLGQTAASNLSNVDAYMGGIEEILGKALSDSQNEAFKNLLTDLPSAEELPGALANILGDTTFTESQVTALENYIDSLYDASRALDEFYDNVMSKVNEALDDMNEKAGKAISRNEQLGATIETYQNIIDLVGKKSLGVTEAQIQALREARVEQSKNNLALKQGQLEMNQLALAEVEAQKKAAEEKKKLAEESGDAAAVEAAEKEIALWDEQIETIQDSVWELQGEVETAWADTLQVISDDFIAAVESATEQFEEAMTGIYGSYDKMQEAYNQQRAISERYVADYQKIYELSKLNRDLTKSIDDTDSIAGKRALRDLQEEINELQESDTEMSAHDLEYLRKKYELRVAEIALEEAQNAKSQVRMQRDAEGNWGYVYTANESQVASAEQNLEDKLYALQSLEQDYIKEMQDLVIQSEIDMINAINALRVEDFATQEEYQAAVARITNFYTGQREYALNELNKAFGNSKVLYEQDWTVYSEKTGLKISMEQDWIDKFEETELALVTGFPNMDSYRSSFEANMLNMTSQLIKAFGDWEQNVKKTFDLVGQDFDNFAEPEGPLDKKTKQINETLNTVNEKFGTWKTAAGEGFKALVKAADDEIDVFNAKILEYQTKIDSVVSALREMLKLAGQKVPETALDVKTDGTQSGGGGGSEGGGTGFDNTDDKTTVPTDPIDDSYSLNAFFSKADGITGKGASTGLTVTASTISNFKTDSAAGYSQFDYGGNTFYIRKEVASEMENKLGIKAGTIESEVKKDEPKGSGSTLTDYSKLDPPFEVGDKVKNAKGDAKTKTWYLESEPGADGYRDWFTYSKINTSLLAGATIKGGSYHVASSENVYLVETTDGQKVYIKEGDLTAYDTGGYTGSWDSSGRLAMLHQKEIVLNAQDTENFLSAINIVRDIASMIDLRAAAQQSALSMMSAASVAPTAQTLQQEVTIHAEFPNATQRTEIEAAFDTLLNRASQFANRKN